MKHHDALGDMRIVPYGKFSRIWDYLSGHFLARMSAPLPEDSRGDHDPFLQKIVHNGRRLFLAWLRSTAKEYQRHKDEHRDIYIACEKNEIELEAQKDAAETKRARHEQARTHRNKIAAAIDRPLAERPGNWINVFLLLAMGLAEGPLNVMSLEAISQAKPWLAYLFAFVIGGTLIFLSYLIGLNAKRALVGIHPWELGEHRKNERYALAIRHVLALTVCVVIAGVIVVLLGRLRQQYIDYLATAAGMPDINTFFSDLPKIALGQKPVPLGREGVTLMLANVAFLIAGATLSYRSRDSVADYEVAERNVESSARAAAKPTRSIQSLQRKQVELDAKRRAKEEELDSMRYAPFLERPAIARFLLMRLGYRKRGYEAKAKATLPLGLCPDLNEIEQAIVSDDEIFQIFPEAERRPAVTEPPEPTGEKKWPRIAA